MSNRKKAVCLSIPRVPSFFPSKCFENVHLDYVLKEKRRYYSTES
jgi:hypothetical protein